METTIASSGSSSSSSGSAAGGPTSTTNNQTTPAASNNSSNSIHSRDALYPLAVLLDELKHDDITLRLEAMRRLDTIAKVLGPERTRDELIPFLEESVEDEDELLTVLAEELGGFVPLVGGPEYAQTLLSPLEALAAIEEPVVRDKAVESLQKIIAVCSPKQCEDYAVPLIKRLANAEWFTNKVSVCALLTVTYDKLDSNGRQIIRGIFELLVHDDTPMVRRASATAFPGLVPHVEKQYIESELMPLFLSLADDDQDSVRLLTVDILLAIAKALEGDNQSHAELLKALNDIYFVDKSWRVRYMVADRFEPIAQTLGMDVLNSEMVPQFVKLMRDVEAEVRTVICKQIPGFAKLLDKETILTEIVPAVEEMSTDQSQHVRAALAIEISSLAPLLGKELTVEKLLPNFLAMLKDEFPDVRLNIICRLQVINDVIGIDPLAQSLLPAITELAQDKQWRVRLAIIEYIPLLASQLGVDFFDKSLRPLCLTWLWDPVYSIRQAVIENLRKLTEIFGPTWAEKTIISQIINSNQHPNFLYRLTILFAITGLAPAVNYEIIKNDILPFVNSLVDDPIPNIRFNIAKSYNVITDLLLKRDTVEKAKDFDLSKSNVSLPTSSPIIGLKSLGQEEGGDNESSSSSDNIGHGRPTQPPVIAKQTTEKTIEDQDVLDEGKQLIEQEILPNLKKLSEDEDVDVRFFANRSIRAVE